MNMKAILLVSFILLSIIGCAPWWQSYNPVISLDTSDVKIFSLNPNEYRPGPKMTKIEVAPAKLPPHLFDDLATLSARVVYIKWNFAFLNNFKSEWKDQIEKGIAAKGNAFIAFGSGDRDYVVFDAPSPEGKINEINQLRSMPKTPFVTSVKKLVKMIEEVDPKGNKKLMGAYDARSGGGVMIFFDSNQVDYLWIGMKDVHRKTFVF